MRHLIVCCDGTWNTAEDRSVTNVRRLFNALAETAEDGNDQLSYYQSGVGSEGLLLSRLLGGGAGVGLSRKVVDAYHWLTTQYEPGDRIALFGFSRGAFTARSLAGMISACGLISTVGLDEATTWRHIDAIHQYRYRQGRNTDQGWRDGLTFDFDPDDAEQIPVRFIGVWDTVGALGIPDNLGVLDLVLDQRGRHEFHDLTLNPKIPHARHAVAMDERRGPYVPTLWDKPAPGQDVKQVWFPGSHKDVGGGHLQTGLSDGALLWMIEEARKAAKLGFNKATVNQIQPNPLDVLHDDDRGVLGLLEPLVDPLLKPGLEIFLEPRPRAVPLIDPGAPSRSVDKSVYDRHQSQPITEGPYRPTRTLAPGDSVTVSVVSRDPWVETGLYLEAGDYRFAATGQWRDAKIPSGPAGTTGLRRFNPVVERFRLLGTLIGQGEQLFRWGTGKKAANAVFSRREENLPWMSLVGVVANDAKLVGDPKDALKAHEVIAIGAGTDHTVTKSGYLYTFANDAWGFYGNNQGSVRLTVTRLQAASADPR